MAQGGLEGSETGPSHGPFPGKALLSSSLLAAPGAPPIVAQSDVVGTRVKWALTELLGRVSRDSE